MFGTSCADIMNADTGERYHAIQEIFCRHAADDPFIWAYCPSGTIPFANMELSVQQLEVPGHILPFSATGKITKGDVVQICGTSGIGKSTFSKAILKFRSSGGISINGIPISQILNSNLREHTAEQSFHPNNSSTQISG